MSQTEAQIKKRWYILYIRAHIVINVCVCVQIKSMIQPLKKKEVLLFATTGMTLEDIVLREVSQTQRDTHLTASLTGELQNTAALTEPENRMGARG